LSWSISEGAAGALGTPRVHLRQVDSTNTYARALALAGAPHGTLISAEEQSAGRGRQGRSWIAPAGSSLLISLVLRWPPTDVAPTLLPLIAGVAVCQIAGAGARLKWPNDVVLKRADRLAKLAGILLEGRPQERWAVLGVGLNVAVDIEELPVNLKDSAASLSRPRAAIEQTLEELLFALQRQLAAPIEQTLSAWRAKDALLGEKVSWQDGSGIASGIDQAGRLLVDQGSAGQIALQAGEVRLGELASG
jgi:BirA family transcriptional regulator, biotin operon repressor / biotin---[acetyl-CoA-carboxylase] ligase